MSHDLRGIAAMVRRAQLASLLLLGCVSLALAADKAAEQLQQLGDDFLEYLGSLEGDDESWMDFVAEAAGNEAAKPQAQLVSSKTSSASSSASSATSSATPPREHAASVNTSAVSTTGKVEK
jgi:hypothetical protein